MALALTDYPIQKATIENTDALIMLKLLGFSS